MNSSPAALAADRPESLIGPDDPPAYSRLNAGGRARALLLADHASNAIPAAMNHLGLGEVPLQRHIAYDIGSRWLTERLAERLDAPALLHGYSRLLIDPNRKLDDPTSVCVISDGVVVPGNRDLTPEDEALRAASFYHPYHDAVAAEIERMTDADQVPAIISMHSFTSRLRGAIRPWHIGILWGNDGRMAVPLIDALRRDPALSVGDNQPYSGRDMHGNTIETHAMPRGLPNVLIEVRQDLIETRKEAIAWADRMADPLLEILSHPSLFHEVVA
ncbi:MAG: N-formylglutamate amidohydrolase [Inquilinus sp.]|nr:N-formylglutamate amidohydrolase [Inquilinus sp.]